MERFVVAPIFRASDGKFYMTGPGEKVYVRISLESNNHLGIKRMFGFEWTRKVKCRLDGQPKSVIYASWGNNPDFTGGIMRSEAFSEQYGNILQSHAYDPIIPSS